MVREPKRKLADDQVSSHLLVHALAAMTVLVREVVYR